ncbi:MAG: GC-type dockerin domain-anchored protein [Phycisphaerales bacterium]
MLNSLYCSVGSYRSLTAMVGVAALMLGGAKARAQCGTSVLWHDGGEVTASHATPSYYLGGAANELRIYSMANPAAPVLESTYILGGVPIKIEKDGDYVYVALGERGVEIIDMTNPAAPVQVQSIGGGNAKDVAVSSGKLFVCWNGDIRTYDVSNPAIPQWLSTYAIGNAIEIESRNNIVFAMGGFTVTAVDFQNPTSPVFRDSVAFAYSTRRMDVRPGTLAVLADSDIYFFDISTPSNITQVSAVTNVATSIDDGTCEFGQADGVPVLYFVNFDHDLDAVSLANPASPQPMPVITQNLSASTRVAAPSTDRVHVAMGSGLISFATTLSGASQVSSVNMGPVGLRGLVTAGNALVAAPGNALLVYDATNPAAPVLAASVPLPDFVNALAADGARVYVQTEGEILQTYDVSNPASPLLLGEDTVVSDAWEMHARGDYLYMTTWAEKFDIYRVADPNNIRRKSSTETMPQADLVVEDGIAYVLSGPTIDVYDTADPSNPELLAVHPAPGFWDFELAVMMPGHILAAMTGSGECQAIDVSNPANPATRATLNFPGLLPYPHAAGSLLVVSRPQEVKLVDWSDPSSPVILPQTLRQSGEMEYGTMVGTVFFATGYYGAGIDAFDLPGLPRLTHQPEAQMVCAIDASAQLSVTLAEPAGATYRWRRGGFPMSNGTTGWGTTISGVTTPTLTFTNPHVQDLALYDCVITNSCGSITSKSVSLFPGISPQIVIEPQDRNVCPSGSATLSVGWLGSLPATFAWQAEIPAGSGTWIGVSDGEFARFSIEGATTRFLTISAQAGETLPEFVQTRYRCVVSNDCGSATSDAATLRICVGDYNCDGFVNGNDFDDFAGFFEAGDPAADVNRDGFVNGDDYDVFAEAFEAGC